MQLLLNIVLALPFLICWPNQVTVYTIIDMVCASTVVAYSPTAMCVAVFVVVVVHKSFVANHSIFMGITHCASSTFDGTTLSSILSSIPLNLGPLHVLI